LTSGPENDHPLSGTSGAFGDRRPYIDWARGIAVVIMIGAHVLDAWTAPAERSSKAFAILNLISGYAAPLFLWLAGLSLVLAADRRVARGSSRQAAAAALVLRGAQVFALAFLFRLQAFIVSPGNPPVSLLRVDILNIMGPSMIAAGLLWRVAGGARAAAGVLGGAAFTLAMATPMVRTASWIGRLPPALQWYLTPAGNHSTFTLIPWAGFVFAGGAFGAILGMAARSRERTTIAYLTVAGVTLGGLAAYLSTRPSIYAASSFWTTSPTYFGIRAGLLMFLLGVLYALVPLSRRFGTVFGVLERFGRHSLFVYWIHVELVYGYATLPLHRRLPLWGTVFGFLLFSAAMYGAIALMLAVVQSWRSRQPGSAFPPYRPRLVQESRLP
jgi:uncharacterized membrane protein